MKISKKLFEIELCIKLFLKANFYFYLRYLKPKTINLNIFNLLSKIYLMNDVNKE